MYQVFSSGLGENDHETHGGGSGGTGSLDFWGGFPLRAPSPNLAADWLVLKPAGL